MPPPGPLRIIGMFFIPSWLAFHVVVGFVVSLRLAFHVAVWFGTSPPVWWSVFGVTACLCHTCRCGSACCGSPGRPPRDVRFSQAPARLKWWVCCVSSCPSAFVEAYCGASMLFKHPRHLVGVTNDENTILIGDPRHVPLCVPSGLLVPPSGNDRRGVACTFHSLPSSPSHCSHRLPPRWLRFFWESICPWPPVQRAGAAPPLYGTASFALLVSLLAFVALLGLLLAAVVVAARRGVCKGRLSRGFCGSQPWQTPPP